MLLQLEQ
jgi:hypothetical protein